MGIQSTKYVIFKGTPSISAERGKWSTSNGEALSRQPLPNDPVGTFTLAIDGIVPGSAIYIRDQADTTTIYSGTATSSNETLQLQVYSPGSPLNSLRIKVRKGSSSPFYRPWETLATAVVGSQSIYVSQIPEE